MELALAPVVSLGLVPGKLRQQGRNGGSEENAKQVKG